MPIIPGGPGSSIAGALFPGAPTTLTQLNLRQMVGEVLAWNPDLDPQLALRFVQNSYRRIIRRRMWKATIVQGVTSSVAPTNIGTVNVTTGSPLVYGSGTAWTVALIGQQFRIGFNFPWYNIVNVDVTNQILFLELPWADVSIPNSAYLIFRMIYNLGPGLRMLNEIRNQLMGFVCMSDTGKIQILNARDTWRAQVGWPFRAVPWPPSPDGNLRVELYPTPFMQQSFPFTAYAQPPDLVEDTDIPLPWIASDVICLPAKAEAIMSADPSSRFYKPSLAEQMMRQYEAEIARLENEDDNAMPKDVSWDYNQDPGMSDGFTAAINHEPPP